MNHTAHTRFYPALLALFLVLISGIFSVSTASSDSNSGKQNPILVHRQLDIHSPVLCFICEEIKTENKPDVVEYKTAHPALVTSIRICDNNIVCIENTPERFYSCFVISSHLPLYLGMRALRI